MDSMRRLAQVFRGFHISEYYKYNPSKLHSFTAHAPAGFELLLHTVSGQRNTMRSPLKGNILRHKSYVLLAEQNLCIAGLR